MVDRLVNSDSNKQRIANVENCFGISGNKLLIPGRVLVGEGVLTKICRKKPKPRQFFLFNDVLVYGSIIIAKKKYNKQHMIPLEEVTLEDTPDTEEAKNGWLIKTPNKSFVVCAATQTEKYEWMAHINKCIDELCKRTGKQPSNTHAAVWIPDSETKRCMHCHKTQFTMVNRRHHCRNCGVVCCGNCSKNKFLIKAQSHKPLRVCDTCFTQLCEGRTSFFENTAAVEADQKLQNEAVSPPERPARRAPPTPKKDEHETKQDADNGNAAADFDSAVDDSDDEPSINSDDPVDALEEGVDNISLEKPTFYRNSFDIEETNQNSVAPSPPTTNTPTKPLNSAVDVIQTTTVKVDENNHEK